MLIESAAALALVALFSLVTWLLRQAYLYCRQTYTQGICVWDISKGHHWVLLERVDPGVFCNVCEQAIQHGVECDFCTLMSHDDCAKLANRRIRCKSLADPSATSFAHHWVSGNLPAGSVCSVCDELCGGEPGICDWRCVWCATPVHTRCKSNLGDVCSFGKFKQSIISPQCIVLKEVGFKGRRRYVVDQVRPPINQPLWRPVIVVGNRKSGNGEGDVVLQSFRKVLNPIQVLDLDEISPQIALAWCQMLKGFKIRIIIAGGDGTVGWLLNTIEDLSLDETGDIELRVFPLGTGNDLSRVLGHGSGHTGPVDANQVIDHLNELVPVKLDRWSVTVSENLSKSAQMKKFLTGFKRRDSARTAVQRVKQLRMSNYFSIGVDALVTFNFHKKRSTLPKILSNRMINKLLFFHYGTKDVLERACRNLGRQLEIYLDGQLVTDLPELEGIVVLNIPSWGAGVEPWGLNQKIPDSSKNETPTEDEPEFKPGLQYISDGKLELFGIYSSFHIAQMQVGLSEPYRIGQAREIRIMLKQKSNGDRAAKIPAQCDGEPWLQSYPAAITVERRGQACMLATVDAVDQLQHKPPPVEPPEDNFYLLDH